MFKYILKKEFLLIFRNLHALLVLFVMPSVFIIIMSLALKNTYSNSIDVKFNVLLTSKKESKDIKDLLKKLQDNNYFNIVFSESSENTKDINFAWEDVSGENNVFIEVSASSKFQNLKVKKKN